MLAFYYRWKFMKYQRKQSYEELFKHYRKISKVFLRKAFELERMKLEIQILEGYLNDKSPKDSTEKK